MYMLMTLCIQAWHSRCDGGRADRLEGCAARALHAGTGKACKVRAR